MSQNAARNQAQKVVVSQSKLNRKYESREHLKVNFYILIEGLKTLSYFYGFK